MLAVSRGFQSQFRYCSNGIEAVLVLTLRYHIPSNMYYIYLLYTIKYILTLIIPKQRAVIYELLPETDVPCGRLVASWGSREWPPVGRRARVFRLS